MIDIPQNAVVECLAKLTRHVEPLLEFLREGTSDARYCTAVVWSSSPVDVTRYHCSWLKWTKMQNRSLQYLMEEDLSFFSVKPEVLLALREAVQQLPVLSALRSDSFVPKDGLPSPDVLPQRAQNAHSSDIGEAARTEISSALPDTVNVDVRRIGSEPRKEAGRSYQLKV